METERDHCIRCGECCLKASPTLQVQDFPLINSHFIKKEELYTIRKGEIINDNINDRLQASPRELIKIRERDGEKKGCIFYDDEGKACKIYQKRPVQCSALKCWDTSEFMRVYREPKPGREDIIEDRVLLGMIQEHETRCSYSTIEKYVTQIKDEGETAVEKILELLRFDYQLRPFVSEKLGLKLEEMDLFFGRPLVQTITMFGLKVIREPDGTFFLTTI
jgi:Fe-S-cluster containining protein